MDSRDWALNGNTISLDEDTVIDVPQPFDKMEMYCASLGHKGNHSFTPNCKYDSYVQTLTTQYKMPTIFFLMTHYMGREASFCVLTMCLLISLDTSILVLGL